MTKALRLTMAALALVLMTSCYQMQTVSKETVPYAEVKLNKKNYRVLATQVSGEDRGFSLLTGLQGYNRFITAYNDNINIFMDIPTVPPGIPIDRVSDSKALDDLYKKSGANQTGRATQLINVRKELGGFNAIIFGFPKIRYTADLIEFCPSGAVASTQVPTAETASIPVATTVAQTVETPEAKPAPKEKPAPRKKTRGRRR